MLEQVNITTAVNITSAMTNFSPNDYLIDFLLTHFPSYQDQLEMVSKKVAQEKKETAIREKAQRETPARDSNERFTARWRMM